jgi:3-isopropylmalate dehydrogenase
VKKLHNFAFHFAKKRKEKAKKDRSPALTRPMSLPQWLFFGKFLMRSVSNYPDIKKSYNYVDAAALNLIRSPWSADVMVMENMFGDILSDLAGGLVGGWAWPPAAKSAIKLDCFNLPTAAHQTLWAKIKPIHLPRY